MTNSIMPIQPMKDGRFVENRIVSRLQDMCSDAGFGMNEIYIAAQNGDFTQQEQVQFAQLIGYSLGGFADLSYVDEEAYGAAERLSKDNGWTEESARLEELRSQLDEAREGISKAAVSLFRIHPDDLKK